MKQETPNLDAMSVKELLAFAYDCEHHELADYARAKALAVDCRQMGSIARATRYEQACDAIYDRLPENLKW